MTCMVEVKSLISDNRRAFFKINKLYAYGKRASENKDCLFFMLEYCYTFQTFHYEKKIVHSYVMVVDLKKFSSFVLRCVFSRYIL